MSEIRFEYTNPRRVVAGTVGQPGERVFYLQVEQDSRITSVKMEKQQVAILAEQLDELVDAQCVSKFDAGTIDAAALAMPLDSEFSADAIAIKYRQGDDFIVIEVTGEPEDADVPSTLAVHLPLKQVRAFTERCRRVVAAGRKPCPICEQPLDPAGHICPRANGYLRYAPS